MNRTLDETCPLGDHGASLPSAILESVCGHGSRGTIGFVRLGLLGLLGLLAACGRIDFAVLDDASPTGDGNGAAADPSLRLWLELEGGSIVDSSMYQLPTTCAANACPAPVAGPRGGAAQFDASDDVIEIPTMPALQPTSFTIALWIRLDVSGQNSAAFAKGYQSAGQNSWEVYVNPARSIVGGGDSVTGAYDSAPISLGTWQHVALRFDGTNQLLYVDGVQKGASGLGVRWDGNPLTLGADKDGSGPTGFWPGAFDDVRFYDRALSPDEIVTLAMP